jgi:hypothetical protein
MEFLAHPRDSSLNTIAEIGLRLARPDGDFQKISIGDILKDRAKMKSYTQSLYIRIAKALQVRYLLKFILLSLL